MKLKDLLSYFLLLFCSSVLALEPVTGSWADISNSQKRTGYSIEVQNGFMVFSMYTYSDNNASTNPTWYNAGGFLKQSKNGPYGTFDLYTVSDNAAGQAGNIDAGSMSIVFKDRETAEITWNNFPGHSQKKSTIKKYWFLGTGTTPDAKRLASLGEWQYSLLGIANPSDFVSLEVVYHNPANYADLGSDAIVGSVGSQKNNVVKILGDNGVDVTLIRSESYDMYNLGIGGGVEYSSGVSAIVKRGQKPTKADYKYKSTAVRRISENPFNNDKIYKSIDIWDNNESQVDELLELVKYAALPENLPNSE